MRQPPYGDIHPRRGGECILCLNEAADVRDRESRRYARLAIEQLSGSEDDAYDEDEDE